MNGDLLVVWLCWCFRQIITMISLGCRLRSRVSEEQWGGGESCADSHRQGPTLSPGCVLIRGRNTRWRRPVVRQTLPSLVTDLSPLSAEKDQWSPWEWETQQSPGWSRMAEDSVSGDGPELHLSTEEEAATKKFLENVNKWRSARQLEEVINKTFLPSFFHFGD